MIWWYDTVFLNREQSNATLQAQNTNLPKKEAPRSGLMSILRNRFQSYQETRRAAAQFNESIDTLSKLSRSQLEDVGLVPADLIALKNGEHKVDKIVEQQLQNHQCEVCYLPSMSERNPEADCGIKAEYCGVAKAA